MKKRKRKKKSTKSYEFIFILCLTEYCSLGNSLSNSSEGLLQRGKEGAKIYRSFCNKNQAVGTSKDDSSLKKTRHLIPVGSGSKESACNVGDPGNTGLIPGSGRSPGGGNGSLLQYSCLQNSTDRGAWMATVHGVAKGWT